MNNFFKKHEQIDNTVLLAYTLSYYDLEKQVDTEVRSRVFVEMWGDLQPSMRYTIMNWLEGLYG
jgi:hypothetical protein